MKKFLASFLVSLLNRMNVSVVLNVDLRNQKITQKGDILHCYNNTFPKGWDVAHLPNKHWEIGGNTVEN